jgi:DNA-directed RNA polymerase subunit RPC12/RpoP
MLDCQVMSEEPGDRRHLCPHCGSHLVRRSFREGFVEKFFYRLIALRPYRCRACGTRFFDRGGGKGRVDSTEED